MSPNPNERPNPLKLFISYSRKDSRHKDKLVEHLGPLKTKGLIEPWFDSRIRFGQGCQIQSLLHQKYPEGDLKFAFALSYGSWTEERWKVVDPFFAPLVCFQGCLNAYVAYYTETDPSHDTITEPLRPHKYGYPP